MLAMPACAATPLSNPSNNSSSGGAGSSGGAAGTGASSSGGAAPVNCKRGLAYGYASPADQAALIPGISWWYNWSTTPDSGVASTYASAGLDFVPMQWGSGDIADLPTHIPSGAKYLLAFNEPNFIANSPDLTPQQAADLWPQLQAVASANHLKLVAPAVNYCGPASDCINGDTSPFDWLTQFLAACTSCQIDYIAVHIYTTKGTYFQNILSQYESTYTQPVWVTEFANLGSTASASDELTFMQEVLPILEADPRVFRYAWFSGRFSQQPSLDVLDTGSGDLTALGQAYVSAPGACSP